MDAIRCFEVRETSRVKTSLRRFTFVSKKPCPHSTSGHHASVPLDERDAVKDEKGYFEVITTPRDFEGWPKRCEACDYEFAPEDEWQTQQSALYALAPDNAGPEDGPWEQHKLPAGAMYYPSWLQPDEGAEPRPGGYCCPTNGSVLMVITPANPDGSGHHEWIVDAYCANCDRKGQVHHCWCRHGNLPFITVNKNPPPDGYGTCGAGAGSIWARMPEGWHGFLVKGWLRSA